MSTKRLVIIASIPIVLLVVFTFVLLSIITNSKQEHASSFRNFLNCEELASRVQRQIYYPYYYDTITTDGTEESTSIPPEFVATNTQIFGIDEADIVKTDGKYIYSIAFGTVVITDIQNPNDPKVVHTIDMDYEVEPVGLLVKNNRLVIIATSYNTLYKSAGISYEEMIYPANNNSQVNIYVYDITDHSSIELLNLFSFDSTYQTARMIDNNIYIIGSYYIYIQDNVYKSNIEELLPRYYTSSDNDKNDIESTLMSECNQISYFGENGNSMTTVVALDINNSSEYTTKVLLGSGQTVYVSESNIYLSTHVYNDSADQDNCPTLYYYLGLCSPSTVDSLFEPAKTEIFRISLNGLNLDFGAAGVVGGTLLNQFSLDEYDGYLRVATSENNTFSTSSIYVLKADDMGLAGSLEGLAPTERIYSARFINDRVYLVTYRNIDPLFVIDLSDPSNPGVLGELKIPGFSQYLHPYKDNYIIGFGYDAVEIGGVSFQEGLKIALFDVTDPGQPTEVNHIIIGGRWSNSSIFQDHKALLFDPLNDMLVIPVDLTNEYLEDNYYYEIEFSGFIVLSLDTESGIAETGRINSSDSYYHYYNSNPRALRIGENLFTVKSNSLQVYRIDDLKKLTEINYY